jgi:dihydrodipicolinate synthase/N-acetylneuraminate lyase
VVVIFRTKDGRLNVVILHHCGQSGLSGLSGATAHVAAHIHMDVAAAIAAGFTKSASRVFLFWRFIRWR